MTTQTNPAVNDPIAEFESFALKPRYECNNKGVFWIGVKTSRDGEVMEQEPIRLADAIELIGNGIDANSDVGGTTHRYQLCVTYTYSNQSDAQYYDSPQKANDDLPYEGYISEFHPKGEVCYRLKETYYSNNLLEEYRYNPDALNGIVN